MIEEPMYKQMEEGTDGQKNIGTNSGKYRWTNNHRDVQMDKQTREVQMDILAYGHNKQIIPEPDI